MKRYYYTDAYFQLSWSGEKYQTFRKTINYKIIDRQTNDIVGWAPDLEQALLIVDALNEENK